MHRSAIAKIEAIEPVNRRPVRVNEAVALAGVLGVPVADLIIDPDALSMHAANLRRQEAEAAEWLQMARVTYTVLRYEVEEQRKQAVHAAALLHDTEQQLEAAVADLAEAERRLAEFRQANGKG